MAIETIGAAGIVVRIETRVAPGAHHDVERMLNRMLVDDFIAKHLKIPPPNPAEPTPAAAQAGADDHEP